MVNKRLLESYLKHPSQIAKGASAVIKERPDYGLSIQDVYDTREEIYKMFPGYTCRQLCKGYHLTSGSAESVYKPEYVEHVQKSYTPKILIFDIETAPLTAYVWKRWKENISLDQTISEWFMLAWSAKWLYSAEVMGDVLTPEEALAQDDTRITEHLWELMDEADIVIAFNGFKFDVPRMNTRFAAAGLNPPKPYILIDPMLTLKHRFGFSSNKLDSLAMFFGIDVKLDTDFELWKRCMQGDAESLAYMLKYNKKDVDILEEVYLRLRPWIKSHPNIANIVGRDVCPFCGVEGEGELMPDKFYYTGVNTYRLYRCPECGAVYRARLPEKGFKPSSSTVVNH